MKIRIICGCGEEIQRWEFFDHFKYGTSKWRAIKLLFKTRLRLVKEG